MKTSQYLVTVRHATLTRILTISAINSLMAVLAAYEEDWCPIDASLFAQPVNH